MKCLKFQLLAVLLLGTTLGYGIAKGFPSKLIAWIGGSSAAQAGEKPAVPGAESCPGCCSDGADKAKLLVMGDPKAKEFAVKAQASGKKPNIIFIMGDDVGWFNIGAYHQGIMAGRTPNLDKLAAAGNAVHRLLRRGQLHRRAGQFHHRPTPDPHRNDDRRPGGLADRNSRRRRRRSRRR